MLNWCKKRFEGACNAMAIASLILFPALGAFGGYWIAQILLLRNHVLRNYDSDAVYIFFGILIGIIVGLVFAIISDILVYGFIAVVIDIKETLHAINSNNCENGEQSINSRDYENVAQKTPKTSDNHENDAQKTLEASKTLQKIVKANDATEAQSQNIRNKKDEENEYGLEYHL